MSTAVPPTTRAARTGGPFRNLQVAQKRARRGLDVVGRDEGGRMAGARIAHDLQKNLSMFRY